jgi:hypothetical protein
MDMLMIDDSFFETDHRKWYYECAAKGKAVGMTVTSKGIEYPVYVYELYQILTTKEIPYYKGSRTFNGFDFIEDYVKGYEKGIKYFNAEFKINPDTLFGNRDTFINNLHICYYHKAPTEKDKGWVYFIHSYPTIVNINAIEKYGFGAAITFSIEELKNKYPVIFKTFDICPESKPGNGQKSFECSLSDEQFQKLFGLVKDIKLFTEPFEIIDLKNIFKGSTTKDYYITNNQNLACLFNYLQPAFITAKWQSVIENTKRLIGNKGKYITAKNLSATLANVDFNSSTSKKIKAIITKL